jgi:signal transduction histidine kinase
MLAARVRATGELLPARLLDAGLVGGLLAVLAAVALGEVGALGAPPSGDVSWAGVALAAARVVALWWRRSHPEAVLAVQLAGAVAARLWLDGDGVATVALLVAVATVASRRGLRAGLLAVAADLLVWLLAVAVAGAPARALADALLRDSLFLVLGLYTGVRASYVQALRDRAERLERERELEARAAVDAERRRIARELHDVVAHHVSVMTLQAGGLEQRLLAGGADPEATGAAAAIRRTGRAAMTELRRLLGVLRPDGAADDRQPQPGLEQIGELVARMREAGLPVALRRQGEDRPVAEGVSLAAYRIVQEALTNTLRHAGPVATEVAVTVTGDAVRVRVADEGAADNGVESAFGRQEWDADRQRRRSGLAGMRERAALSGGTVQAGPRPGGGWLVEAELPTGGTPGAGPPAARSPGEAAP